MTPVREGVLHLRIPLPDLDEDGRCVDCDVHTSQHPDVVYRGCHHCGGLWDGNGRHGSRPPGLSTVRARRDLL